MKVVVIGGTGLIGPEVVDRLRGHDDGVVPASPGTAIARAVAGADAGWRAALQAVSLADLARSVDEGYGPGVLAGIRSWLGGSAG